MLLESGARDTPMSNPLSAVGVDVPVLVAPMAGGPSTPALVVSAAESGSIGFLAAGYKSIDVLSEQIAQVRSRGVSFGVNVFVPNPHPVDPAQFRLFAAEIQAEADAYGLDLTSIPIREDDDLWDEKIDLLLHEPVPIVSFTFGIPDRSTISALRRSGSVVIQTVTSADEAAAAADAGVDMLAVQASAAGGHSGTLTPEHVPPPIPLEELVSDVRRRVDLPLIGAGGVVAADDIKRVIAAGALGVMVGTMFLRTDQSGASEAHRSVLGDGERGATILTRAFTGRPARAIPNRFTDRYGARAPLGYPAVHYLTIPLRKAAAAAHDPELINLWAGTGHSRAECGPASGVLSRLVENV